MAYNINQTFIIEPCDGSPSSGTTNWYTTGTTTVGDTVYFNRNDQMSAYTLTLTTTDSDKYTTGFTYSENSLSIRRNDGVVLSTIIDSFTGMTVHGSLSATTLYGDGRNLYGVLDSDKELTGATYGNGVLTFRNKTTSPFSVAGFYTGGTDTYLTGGTYGGGVLVFTNNTGGTFNISGLYTGATDNDRYITGGTYNGGYLSLSDNSGGTVSIGGFYTGATDNDRHVTGGTYSQGVLSLYDNSGSTINVNGFFTGDTYHKITGATYNDNFLRLEYDGGTIQNLNLGVFSGLTVYGSISATTYQNLPQYPVITGGTYGGDTLRLVDSTGGTLTVYGFYTGGTDNDRYITGGTYSNGGLNLFDNSGGTVTVGGFYTGGTDTHITGGTYAGGTLTLRDNSSGVVSINGFYTGDTTQKVTGLTYNQNFIYQYNSDGSVTPINIGNFSGLTVSGTLSATTYLNLPKDIYVTGGTYSNGTAVFVNNTGGTYMVTGFYTGGSSTDRYTTGTTYANGSLSIYDNQGGSVSTSGFFTGDTYHKVTGITYSNNILNVSASNGQRSQVLINTMTGLTVSGSLSAATYMGLPPDTTITGGTYSGGTISLINNTGGTVSISGLYHSRSPQTCVSYLANDDYMVSGTTSEIVGHVIPTYGIGEYDMLHILTRVSKNTTGATAIKLYANSSTTLDGYEVLLGQYVFLITNTYLEFDRRLIGKGGGSYKTLNNGATTALTDKTQGAFPISIISIPYTNTCYFLVTVKNSLNTVQTNLEFTQVIHYRH